MILLEPLRVYLRKRLVHGHGAPRDGESHAAGTIAQGDGHACGPHVVQPCIAIHPAGHDAGQRNVRDRERAAVDRAHVGGEDHRHSEDVGEDSDPTKEKTNVNISAGHN